jgi:hypothetical protein
VVGGVLVKSLCLRGEMKRYSPFYYGWPWTDVVKWLYRMVKRAVKRVGKLLSLMG